MSVFIARNNSKGFTLLEMMIVLMLVGIMAAIATPSFLAMNNNSKVNDAVTKVSGALQEAQKEAMRKSQTCGVQVSLVTINNKATPVLTGVFEKKDANGNLIKDANGNSIPVQADSCLTTGQRVLTDISITNSPTLPWNIYFDYKGRINNASSAGTIYFSILNTPTPEKCITISQGIGLFRPGKKSGNSCTTTQLN
ncbi:type 4 pilin [Crinalium epipsammum PCC 9333]|uniref:Type 4 pilin n=1 Tax=Crinalium epipsammum PCC 9333 TaxID=1173022 RepID=K9VWW7_9CYAN|nr:prepilin-type N-terminal cleavage/methylation domain-containing protein [Crinalium epipsammum]AFZ12588.1 type 4 pilin [Crinalium epipsammum PCC 9333]